MPEDKKAKNSAQNPATSAPAATTAQPAAQTTPAPQAPPAPKGPEIKFVMMKRITDGDGPHPIHPAEVDNYIRGDWVVVEEGK